MATLPPGLLKTDDIYEVEKIVDSEVRDGQVVYRVRWKGCTRDEDTWEPEDNLLTCGALLKSFKEDQESKRRKRRIRRIERRRDFFRRNSTPLQIKVKDEGNVSDEEKGECDEPDGNDRVSAVKKTKTPSALVSPSSDFDDFDLSGLTRKQRQDVQKMIEESKRDADLVSPTSSTTTEENEPQGKDDDDEEETTNKRIIPQKRKRIGRRAVIDDSSDSEQSDEDTDVGNTSYSNADEASTSKSSENEHKMLVDNNNTTDIDFSNANTTTADTSTTNNKGCGGKERHEQYVYKGDNENENDNMDDVVAKDKGKKASEILDNIFNTPKKVVNSPFKQTIPAIPSSGTKAAPFKTLVDSPTSKKLNSPIRISISDDSNDESFGDKESLKRRRGDIEIGYVPLFDQLQKRMDPLMSSLDLNDKLLSPNRPFRRQCYQNDKGGNNINDNSDGDNSSTNNNDGSISTATTPITDRINSTNTNNGSPVTTCAATVMDTSSDTTVDSSKSDTTINCIKKDDNFNCNNDDNNMDCDKNDNIIDCDKEDDTIDCKTNDNTIDCKTNDNTIDCKTNDNTVDCNKNDNTIDYNKNDNFISISESNTSSVTTPCNTSQKDEKRTEVNLCASASETNVTSSSSLLTVIPSSSTLKVDVGKNKRTYMQGVENIRNTLAMKRMLLNPPATSERAPEKKTSQVVETMVLDQGYSNNRNLSSSSGPSTGEEIASDSLKQSSVPVPVVTKPEKVADKLSPAETVSSKIDNKNNSLADRFKRALDEGSHLQRVHKVISSIDISSEKTTTDDQEEDVDANADAEKDTAEKNASTKASDSNLKGSSPVNKNELRGSDPKVYDPRSHANILSKTVHHKHPNKMNRHDKLAYSKSANGTRRPEKAKKLSLKEYNAKKASKQQAPPILEFTKLPKLQRSYSTPEKVTTAAAENQVATPPTTPPSKLISERRSSEKKDKGPKPSQLATNTDVLGNILDCFRQPLGRDSTSQKSNDEQESPMKRTVVVPEVTDSDIEAELDDYSGDEDGMLRAVAENNPRPSHLTLPHANTKTMELLAIYQAMMREDIETLIRVEIPPDKINSYVDHQDTLIMKAVVLKSIAAAQILLEKKADPNVLSKLGPRNGKSPLMVATEMNHKSMVLLLVQHNAKMNIQTQNGETALILAAKLGHMEVIHALLNSGADVKPAATMLEKKVVPGVPGHLLLELQSTLRHHTMKLRVIAETFLSDLLSARNTKLGQQLMPLRCVSPDEMDEHEFYFKCTVNAVEPCVNVLMLALPVIFRRNGGVEVKYNATENGIKNVYLNDGQMFPTAPGSTMLYFLFPKSAEINTLRIQSSGSCKYKLLLCIYALTYKERVDKAHRTMLIQAASAPVPVH